MDYKALQQKPKSAHKLRVRLISTIFTGEEYIIQQVSLPEYKRNAISVTYDKKNNIGQKI